MKKLLAFICLLSWLYNTGISQGLDRQWLIRNGLGKEGTTGYSNMINNQFTLVNIHSPNTDLPQARNDLFVIFSDGTHFNSRYESPTHQFFVGTPGSVTTNQGFQTGSPVGISYAYLTNIYESDDIPDLVSVPGSIQPAGQPITLKPSKVPILSATHDVVAGKDITLIVNTADLPNTIEDFYIQYNLVRQVNYNNHFPVNLFGPSPIFGDGQQRFDFPADPTTQQQGSIIKFKANAPFLYFNFRPTELFHAYGPDLNGNITHYAVFQLYYKGPGNKPIEIKTHQEPLVYSHDPNFLAVQSFCYEYGAGRKKHTYIKYHLEFMNTGLMQASDISAAVTMPSFVDVTCMRVLEWKLGGNPVSGDITPTGFPSPNRYSFNFSGNLSACPGNESPLCKGYVEFIVKAKGNFKVHEGSNSLHLLKPKVFFGQAGFEIKEFRDIKEYNSKLRKWQRRLSSPCETCH